MGSSAAQPFPSHSIPLAQTISLSLSHSLSFFISFFFSLSPSHSRTHLAIAFLLSLVGASRGEYRKRFFYSFFVGRRYSLNFLPPKRLPKHPKRLPRGPQEARNVDITLEDILRTRWTRPTQRIRTRWSIHMFSLSVFFDAGVRPPRNHRDLPSNIAARAFGISEPLT